MKTSLRIKIATGTTGFEPVTSQFLKIGFNPSTIYPLTSMRLLL
nr:MAG TPA: hypothetical protein [Caudoviricetes sp.]